MRDKLSLRVSGAQKLRVPDENQVRGGHFDP